MRVMITKEKTAHHAEILANRVRKMYNHLRKRFAKQNIDCYRLYDWDIPEVRAVVDYYKGHLVIGEYVRMQTSVDWLPTMAEAVGKALKITKEKIHVKERRTSTHEEPRYRRMQKKDKKMSVNERDLKFWVNMSDFLDTGLFSDHRNTRVQISKLASGKDFLNLFCYTGAFTCAAARGGAKTTVSVDRSETYLNWAKENFKLNGLDEAKNFLVKADVFKYLEDVHRKGIKFSLAMVDPPSFYRLRKTNAVFDINQDHPKLIKAVVKIMKKGSLVYFSTNHQRFEPKLTGLNIDDIREMTDKTVPEDYRNKQIHRCWEIVV